MTATLDDLLASSSAALVVAFELDAVHSVTGEVKTWRGTDARYLAGEDVNYTLALKEGWTAEYSIGEKFHGARPSTTFGNVVFSDPSGELGSIDEWKFEGQRAVVKLGGNRTATGEPFPLDEFAVRFEGISKNVAGKGNSRVVKLASKDTLEGRPINTEEYQGFGMAARFSDARLTSLDVAGFDAPDWALTLRGKLDSLPATDSVFVSRAMDWGITLSPSGKIGILANGTATESLVTISPGEHFALSLTASAIGLNSTLTLRHRKNRETVTEALAVTLPTADITIGGGGLVVNRLGMAAFGWDIFELNFADFAVGVDVLDKAGTRAVDASAWLYTWRFEGEGVGSVYLSEQATLELAIVDGTMDTTPTFEGDDATRWPGASITGAIKQDGIGECHDLPVKQVSTPGRAYQWSAPGTTDKLNRVKRLMDVQTANVTVESVSPGQIEIFDAPPEIVIDAAVIGAEFLPLLVPGIASPQRDGQLVQLLSAGSPNDALSLNVGAGGAVLVGGFWRIPLEDSEGDPAVVVPESLPAAATFGAIPGRYRYTPNVAESVAIFEEQVAASEIRVDADLRGGAGADVEFAATHILGRPPRVDHLPVEDLTSPVSMLFKHGKSSIVGDELTRLTTSLLGWWSFDVDGLPALGIFSTPAEHLAFLQSLDPLAAPVAASVGSSNSDVFASDETPPPIISTIKGVPGFTAPTIPAEVFTVLYDRTHATTEGGEVSSYIPPEERQRMQNPWRAEPRGEVSGADSSTVYPPLETVLTQQADASRVADRMESTLSSILRFWPLTMNGRAFSGLPIGSLIWIQHPDPLPGLQIKKLAILTRVKYKTGSATTEITCYVRYPRT